MEQQWKVRKDIIQTANSKIMAILIKVLPSPQNILKNERLMYKTQLYFYAVNNEYE